MRFGVKSAQTSAMLPKDRVPEDIQKYIAEFDYVALVESVAARGFNLLELGGDVALFFPHSFSPASIEQLLELKHRRNLSYTVHLPQWSIEPSTPQPPAINTNPLGSSVAVCPARASFISPVFWISST